MLGKVILGPGAPPQRGLEGTGNNFFTTTASNKKHDKSHVFISQNMTKVMV